MSGRAWTGWIAVVLLASAAACTGAITGDAEDKGGSADGETDDPGDADSDSDPGVVLVTDPEAPHLVVEAPERGTIIDGDTVFVSGRVTETSSAVKNVLVNGRAVGIASDGSFEAAVTLPPGITLIQTVATSVDDHVAADVRAVLGGTLVEPNTAVAAGVTAHIGPRAIDGMADKVAEMARALNLTSLATSQNPIVSTGSGCNSAQIRVESISRSSIAVGAAAVNGGIDTGAHVRGLVVRGRVYFRALCISASTSWTISSDVFGMRGMFAPSLSGGGIRVGLSNLQAGFSGFRLGIGGVPGFITDLFAGAVRDWLARTLRDRIAQIVPPQVNSLLRDFVADSVSVSQLGKTITTSIYPTSMTWSIVGGSIALRTSSAVAGSAGVPYVSTPRMRPTAATMVSSDLRVAVADDAANQLLSAVWASGALEAMVSPTISDQLDDLGIDNEFSGAVIDLSLPPVADFDEATGTARISIGDLVIDPLDALGQSAGAIVVSAEVDLVAVTAADGRLQIAARPPRLIFQALDEGSAEILDVEAAGMIARAATEQLATELGRLLETLPVPGLPGVVLKDVGMAPIEGYLVMGGTLTYR